MSDFMSTPPPTTRAIAEKLQISPRHARRLIAAKDSRIYPSEPYMPDPERLLRERLLEFIEAYSETRIVVMRKEDDRSKTVESILISEVYPAIQKLEDMFFPVDDADSLTSGDEVQGNGSCGGT